MVWFADYSTCTPLCALCCLHQTHDIICALVFPATQHRVLCVHSMRELRAGFQGQLNDTSAACHPGCLHAATATGKSSSPSTYGHYSQTIYLILPFGRRTDCAAALLVIAMQCHFRTCHPSGNWASTCPTTRPAGCRKNGGKRQQQQQTSVVSCKTCQQQLRLERNIARYSN